MEQPDTATDAAEFLFKRSVLLLTPAIGKAAAENLMRMAMKEAGINPTSLTQDDMPRLAAAVEPTLGAFVGSEQAKRLSYALGILVDRRMSK